MSDKDLFQIVAIGAQDDAALKHTKTCGARPAARKDADKARKHHDADPHHVQVAGAALAHIVRSGSAAQKAAARHSLDKVDDHTKKQILASAMTASPHHLVAAAAATKGGSASASSHEKSLASVMDHLRKQEKPPAAAPDQARRGRLAGWLARLGPARAARKDSRLNFRTHRLVYGEVKEGNDAVFAVDKATKMAYKDRRTDVYGTGYRLESVTVNP